MQPVTSTAPLSLVEPDPPDPSCYSRPHGIGLLAWLGATSIAFVLALACLTIAWLGGVA